MHPEDVGDLHREGRVHVDRHLRQAALLAQALECVDDLLGPFEGEGWDDDLAAAPGGARDHVGELVVHALDGIVQPIAVGALGDEHVSAARDLRVTEDRHVPAAQVPREDESLLGAHVVQVEHHDGAAEHMARVEKGHLGALRDRLPPMVGQPHHQAEQTDDVLGIVEGLDGQRVHVVARDALVQEARVALLDHRRVGEHRRAQVARRRRRVDRPPVALSVEQRKGARVIDVRV